MLRFVADENFNNHILRALRHADSPPDVIRVQDTEVYQADDPTVLEWAAQNGRVLLTHDVNTMTKYAYERMGRGEPMPGVLIVDPDAAIGSIVNDLLIIAGATEPSEIENHVDYVPLR